MKNYKLTVIIPVFNEKNTIEILLRRIFKIKISKQIIIVDDHSTDGTRNVIKKYKNKVDKLIQVIQLFQQPSYQMGGVQENEYEKIVVSDDEEDSDEESSEEEGKKNKNKKIML